MDRKNIVILVATAIVCLTAGYWFALPRNKAVAPTSGVPVNIVSIADASSSQIYKVEGEYPQFANASSSMNAAIADFVNTNLSQFKTSSQENWQARLDTMPTGTANTLPAQSFYFSSSWEPGQINDHYISVIVRIDYFNGGANGTQLLKTFNYDVSGERMLLLTDLFPGVTSSLQQISKIAIEQLTSSAQSASAGNAPVDMIESGATSTADNYANFMFNDDTVTVYFPKYQAGPGYFGEQKVSFVRSAIK
jgi:hypothetical protein